jgi:hypothetical protein
MHEGEEERQRGMREEGNKKNRRRDQKAGLADAEKDRIVLIPLGPQLKLSFFHPPCSFCPLRPEQVVASRC